MATLAPWEIFGIGRAGLGALRGIGSWIRNGTEFVGKNFRIAPFGNRTGHPTGKYPHYHRRVPHPTKPGEGAPGQGMKRHRPWDTKGTDKSFWDRF